MKTQWLRTVVILISPNLWRGSSSSDCRFVCWFGQVSIFLKPAGFLGFVLVIITKMQKAKPRNDSTFYTSVCNILTKIPLVSVSHMFRLKTRDREVHSFLVRGATKSQGTRYGYKKRRKIGKSNSICYTPILKCTGTVSPLADVSILKSIKCFGLDKSTKPLE